MRESGSHQRREPGRFDGLRARHWLSRPGLALACVGALLVGCAYIPGVREATIPSYQPSNVHREETHLPAQIKRVAMLPVTALGDEAVLEFGRDTLGPVLMNELGKARQFELVPVTGDELRILTGREAWTGEEKLPLDFFDRLKERLGVDAVLFARLTQYQAYQPLKVGWRVKLLETEEPRVLWAVDEVFDARMPSVAAAARRFARHQEESGAWGDADEVLSSPRRFGEYSANAVVGTMPVHGSLP
jgi:hypothetical protein